MISTVVRSRAEQRLVLDTSFLTSRGFLARSNWRAHTHRFLVQHTRLAQLVRVGRIAAREATTRPQRFTASDVFAALYLSSPPDSMWAEAWMVTDSLVTLMDLECRSRQIPFYLVTLSNPEQVTPDTARQRELAAELGVPDLFQAERRLEELGNRQGFDVLPLAPLLSAHAIETHEYYHGVGKYKGLGHWNAR